MVSVSSIELLTELRECEDYENAVLATFNFNSTFFESQVLPRLRNKDIQNITVLIDNLDLEDTFEKGREIGVYYLLEPISRRDTFHPKFILLTSPESGKLMIGSANLTHEGYTSNSEIISNLEFFEGTPSIDALPFFYDMREFLKKLIGKEFIKSTKHAEKILEALDVSWLNKDLTHSKENALIHSLDVPILEQILSVLKEQKIERVVLSSYLISSKVIRYICENICKKIDIIIQPERVIGVLQKEIDQIIKETKAKINFFKITFEEENRFHHAKIIIIKTNRGSYCLTGSANLTTTAMLSTPPSGNVEVCILRFEKKKKYFDYIFQNSNVKIEKIDLSEISPIEASFEPPEKSYDINIIEAKIEGNQLIIRFSPSNPSHKFVRITIKRPVATESVIFDNHEIADNEIIIELDDAQQKLCQASCYVVFELRKEMNDNAPLLSNKRWISTEVAELIPSKRDVKKIIATDGRIGLIGMLNQLDKAGGNLQILLDYLQSLDFDWLSNTLNPLRKQLIKPPDDDGEESDFMLERQWIKPEDALKKIVKRHQRKFNRLMQDTELSHELFIKREKVFNLLMFMNKIIIWFVLNQKKCSVSELVHICGYQGTINLFCNEYINRLRNILGVQETHKFIESQNITAHILVQSKIIRDLQRNNPSFERKNVWPIRRFYEIYHKSLRNLSQETNEISIDWDALSNAVDEYKEFQDVDLRLYDIKNHLNDIIQN